MRERCSLGAIRMHAHHVDLLIPGQAEQQKRLQRARRLAASAVGDDDSPIANGLSRHHDGRPRLRANDLGKRAIGTVGRLEVKAGVAREEHDIAALCLAENLFGRIADVREHRGLHPGRGAARISSRCFL